MMDFISAVAPWIVMGLALAFFFANHKKIQKNNYASEGIAIGLIFGTAFGCSNIFSLSTGISLGMFIGLMVGTFIPKK